MKKNRAIVFTLSSDITFAIACLMMDIKRISPTIADEIVLIHNGIGKKDQSLLSSILPCRFLLYDFPIKDTSIFNQETLSYFTKMVFAKFECLKLLDEYANVLYLDPDMVYQQDISELFEPCISGIKMMTSEGATVRDQLHEPIFDYNMDATGICGCIFVFQDHLNDYLKLYDFCYKSLYKYARSLYLGEQAIFDFMIQEFNLTICPIDEKLYSPHPTDKQLAENAKIIHAYGQPKFWNGLYNENWNKNYAFWLKMGGSRFKQKSLLKSLGGKLLKEINNLSKFLMKK